MSAKSFSIRFSVERKRKGSRGPKFKVQACVPQGRAPNQHHAKRCAWGGGKTVQLATHQALQHLQRGFVIPKKRRRKTRR